MNNGYSTLIEHIKMIYFMNFRDLNNYQNISILFFISIFTILSSVENINELINYYLNYLSSLCNFANKKSIILEGRHCFRFNNYSSKSDNIFSNRFEAFWYFITSKNLDNPEIFQIKEYVESLIDDDFNKKTIKKSNNYIIINFKRKKLVNNIIV